jgi:outer membrane protein assembly factor BamA
MTLMNISGVNILDPSDPGLYQTLITPSVKYVYDDVLWGYLAPVQGTRFYLDFMGSPKLSNNGLGFGTFSTDIRQYFNIGSYYSLALRGKFGASFGPNPNNFMLGGTSNWLNRQIKDRTSIDENATTSVYPIASPSDFAFMNLESPMRGFPIDYRRGSKFFVTNTEFRFPMFTALVAGPLPILVQGVMGSFFTDIGGAWDKDFTSVTKNEIGETVFNDLMISSGVGIRAGLFGIPIKMDIAWRKTYSSWSEPYYLFSIGFDY